MSPEIANLAVQKIRQTRGLASVIAREVGITRAGVAMWRKVPAKHAFAVAQHLNMALHEVCPEVFPGPRRERTDENSTRD